MFAAQWAFLSFIRLRIFSFVLPQNIIYRVLKYMMQSDALFPSRMQFRILSVLFVVVLVLSLGLLTDDEVVSETVTADCS